MLTEDEILLTLDNSNSIGDYCQFINLGHPYSYLIDCRLNIFKGENDRWAIAAERVGYNPRGGTIELEIDYFGNCLVNLEIYNGQLTNYYIVNPIEQDSFFETIDEPYLKPDSKYWLVNRSKVELSHLKQDYLNNGIELKEYEPGQIGIEEAARLIVIGHRDLFRANDDELYKSIPNDLRKILVLDEWHHRDFIKLNTPAISEEQLKSIYAFNKEISGLHGMDFETFATASREQELRNEERNKKEWTENRPSVYETWQQIVKVIATGDISFYNPTLPPNTHWLNWPDSGSL
jgi:hypothetical protein